MATPPGHARTVLIADETEVVRERFAAALGEGGHHVLTADSGEAALALARAHEVDLVVIDLQLPQGHGVAVVRALRELLGDSVPIVVFSGTIASADEVRLLASLGVAGYVNEYSAAQHIVACLAPYLYPDNFDRRASPRVNLALAISYRAGTSISSSLTLNLGKGGVAIRTMSPPERGSTLRLRFRLPGSSRDIEADSHVCWANRNIGMGVQFDQLAHGDQAAIDEFVDMHFFSNRKA